MSTIKRGPSPSGSVGAGSSLSRSNNAPAYRRSRSQEAELASSLGGRRTPGSGNKGIKGDIRGAAGGFRIEAKCTSNKSYSIKRDDFIALADACMLHGERPAYAIEFIQEGGKAVSLVVVTLDAFKELTCVGR